MNKTPKLASQVPSVLITLLIVGCASVSVRKIPTPTQYNNWSDCQQTHADSIRGLRFYMPRPFINVFESFPIRTDIYMAQGEVSPDGKFVLIRQLSDFQGNTPLKLDDRPFTAVAAKDVKMERTSVSTITAAKPAGVVPQAATETNKTNVVNQTSPTNITHEAEQDSPGTPGTDSPETGLGRMTMKNDNNAFAYQPLRGNFDIVYLPDFEEQYAVRGFSGLGNFQLAVNMGQGWSLQGLDAVTDNSELNKRVFSFIDTALKLGEAAASAAMGLPPGTASIVAQKATETIEGKVPAGTPVTLRIVVVHYAAKGMYPVLKPSEMQPRIIDGYTSYLYCADLSDPKCTPKHRGLYSPDSIAKSQSALDAPLFGHFTVPKYPYQYISFNTFQYISVEAVTPTGGPGGLYDSTGVKGGSDRQAAALADLINRMANGGGTSQDDTQATNQIQSAFIGKLKDAIAKAAAGSNLKGRQIDDSATNLTRNGSNYDVALFMKENAPAKIADAEAGLKIAVSKALQEALTENQMKLGVGDISFYWKQ